MRMFQIFFKILKPLIKMTLTFAILWAVFQYSILRVTIVTRRDYTPINQSIPTMSLVTNLEVINVLIWSQHDQDFDSLLIGQDAFIKSKCENINCYITRDRHMLGEDYSAFDAILINAKDALDLPRRRSQHQKYVFATRDLDVHRPVCDKNFDDYFNLTFTPKFDSDAVWSYFPIVTSYKQERQIEGVLESSQQNTSKRNSSRLYAAFYVNDDCHRRQDNPISYIQLELKRFFLDVKVVCAEDCFKAKDCTMDLPKYYFYLVLEEQSDIRRVVSHTLEAIQHNTIPVILGPTDYTRYLPPNSFINAWKLGPKNTAITMAKLISNETAYMSYFDWQHRPLYRVNMSSECRLCELLNRKENKTYRRLRDWWNPTKSHCPDDWLTTDQIQYLSPIAHLN